LKSILRFSAIGVTTALVIASTPPARAGQAPAGHTTPTAPTAPTAQAAANAPFARVYLALRGCTSCSHCRTNIRQMVRSKSDGGQAHLASDQVEVLYPKPRTVPLREVVRSLAENRLHDLTVVDVLFEARGSIAATKTGTTFRMAETGQSFPISIDRAVKRPADGTRVRVTALVDGWRTKDGKGANAKGSNGKGSNGDLSLVARTIDVVN
jgi:hypothetical protein